MKVENTMVSLILNHEEAQYLRAVLRFYRTNSGNSGLPVYEFCKELLEAIR